MAAIHWMDDERCIYGTDASHTDDGFPTREASAYRSRRRRPEQGATPVTERLITHVRHVDLAVPDYEREREFYTNTWGLTVEAEEPGLTYLAAEGSPEQYIVRLRKNAEKRMELWALGARDAAAVDTLAERLAQGGVQLVSEPGKLQTPAPDPGKTRTFYERFLGFSLTDTLFSPHMGEVMWFMRTSDHHHNIAIARCPHVSLHHVSFEMRRLDEYMRGTGRLMRAGVEKIWGPGGHLAGNNTFSYFLDPRGNTVEYTTELATIDEDTWHPHLYDFSDPEVTDPWGTANTMNELVAKKSFNDPDAVFVAPPV
jgi:catechol 2,3-dioxygenase-like lactoylglutathione lyase family enzyme